MIEQAHAHVWACVRSDRYVVGKWPVRAWKSHDVILSLPLKNLVILSNRSFPKLISCSVEWRKLRDRSGFYFKVQDPDYHQKKMSHGLLLILIAALFGTIKACGPGAPRKARPIPPRPMKRDIHLPSTETSDLKSLMFDVDKTKIDIVKMTEDLFTLFDQDADGFVTTDEISTAREVESLTNAVWKADRNGDGIVTLQEFQTIMMS
ncbi:uncharacterized protein LOC117109161 [Anneissia japonica]|uniref:uncharacterized protein LOC117109161 n=1 Tax=Anneissia japonica TaxID=1529436 RepID=UPI001425AB00|nr:uncharacterized protein LOC117109161 [Anneissia japonica]